MWQDPKLDRQVVVGPDGMISFPLAGHIKAAGITPQALENLLRARLQKNYTGKLDVTVSLAAVNPTEAAESKPRVYISGEVLKPGPYPRKAADQYGAGHRARRRAEPVRGQPPHSDPPQDPGRRYRSRV